MRELKEYDAQHGEDRERLTSEEKITEGLKKTL